MTRFKKLLALTLVFVGAIGLAGCKPEVEGPSDLEQLAEALLEVDLAAEASSDLTFPGTGLHDVVITWESSDTDVIANDGTVTIPLFTEGDQVVTITASFTLGDDTLTKTFEVTVLAATTKTDAEKLVEAKVALLLPVAGLVLSNITLPDAALDAAVTWSSSNTAVITDAGLVTRPLNGEGNAEVTLTATLTLGTETDTKTFDVTVREEEPSSVFTSIPTMHTSSILNDIVEFQGIVTATFGGGYFLSDGTYALGVYTGSSTAFVLGDEVYVKGSYAVYNTLFQVGSPTVETLISSGNTIALTPMVKTIAEMIALDSSDPLIHGMYYEITGTLELCGSYDNVCVVDGDSSVLVYYSSLATSITALEDKVGMEVVITVVYYTDHSNDGVLVVFQGGADDIVVAALNDVDALAADLAAVGSAVPNVSLSDITLPAVGPNGTAYTGWTSSNTAVITDAGVFVAADTTTVTITFTATATKGTETGTATLEVVVPILSTVGEVIDMTVGDYFYVTGTVYEESYYGFYIHADGKYAFVYGSDLLDSVEPGQEVTILGFLGKYSGLLQLNVVEMTTGATGGAAVTAITGTVGELENDLVPRGTIVTVIGTISIEGSYDNVYITGPAGGKVVIYYRSNADELVTLAGSIVTIDLIGYQDGTVLYQGVLADATVETAFTDAQKVADAAAVIDLGEIGAVESDLTLPLTEINSGATITWATSDAAVVTDAGVVIRVAGSDTLVTLTATVTVGAEVVTRDFVITVVDANDSIPMSVIEALALTDGDSVLVVGVITGMYYDERIIQGPDGSALWVDSNIGGAIGDEIVVRGTLTTYDSYGNNSRKIYSATVIETLSSGNVLVIDAETDPEVIVTEFAEQRTYTATLTIDSFNSYGDVFFDTGAEAMQLSFDYELYAPYIMDVYAIGDAVEVTFTILDVNYGAVRVVNVTMPVLTEAQNMLAAKGALEVDATVTADITLETALADYNATITWASSNELVITTAGVITRPLNGEGDVDVTLTATIVIGALTEDVVFAVTVSEELPDAAPLFFSQYGEPAGGSCKYVEIYNPTDATVSLVGYTISSPDEGDLFSTNYRVDVLTGDILSGQTIVVGAAVCFDGSDPGSFDAGFPQSGIVYIISSGNATSYFNGDDSLGLFFGETLIDMIGNEGELAPDAGEDKNSWVVGNGDLLGGVMENAAMIRIPSVVAGEVDWSVGAMQWIVIDDRDYTDVGTHTCDLPTS